MTESRQGIDPERTALLVMDYQPVVLGSLSDADELLSRVAEAIAIVRRHGGQVGYVRVAFDDADYEAVPEHSAFAPVLRTAREVFHSDSPATGIHERVAPESGDIIVRKTRIGAFSTTDLAERLRDRGIATLILAGVSTSGVVLSTVRDAADRDYRVFVLADATADPEPGVHGFLTERVFPRQAHVITVAELDGLLSGTNGRST
ncbi:MAG TPA: cysteine hydrolase [Solirubrobacteraceae bacterium]|nr:cysteine hydrolase [Solirubrobacteraceae bacterium]